MFEDLDPKAIRHLIEGGPGSGRKGGGYRTSAGLEKKYAAFQKQRRQARRDIFNRSEKKSARAGRILGIK